jgi:glycogen operon protein
VVRFTLPSAIGGREWLILIDTNQPDLAGLSRFPFGHVYEITGRSLLLFMLRPAIGVQAGGDADQSFAHVVNVLRQVDRAAEKAAHAQAG